MSIIQCKKVIEKMEIIADWMDMQELEAARLRKVEEQKRQDEDLQRKLEKLLPKAPVGQVREKEKKDDNTSSIVPVSVVPEVAPPTFEEHMGELFKLMQCGLEQKGVSDKKVAATFFFHEHVICILKSFTLKGELRYELVDSMPRNMKPGLGPASAVRVRCLDIEGLKVLLSWYACSRFSDSNCDFIDQHGWDENNCDFDPRVFQAFVWSEL